MYYKRLRIIFNGTTAEWIFENITMISSKSDDERLSGMTRGDLRVAIIRATAIQMKLLGRPFRGIRSDNATPASDSIARPYNIIL